MAPQGHPLIIWYNTLCPVCRLGINWQKQLLLPVDAHGDVIFRDINDDPQALLAFGADLDAIRKRLHATPPDGKLLVGIDVVIALMQKSPTLRWLAYLIALPGLRMLAGLAYDGFAEVLYAWNRRKGHW